VIRSFGSAREECPLVDSKWNAFSKPAARHPPGQTTIFYVVQSHGRHLTARLLHLLRLRKPTTFPRCATPTPTPRACFVHRRHSPAASPGDEVRQDWYLLAFRQPGPAYGLLPLIHHSLVVAPMAKFWVGNRASTKVVVFDKDLKQCATSTQEPHLRLLCRCHRPVVDVDRPHGMVLKMGWDGNLQGWFGKHGDAAMPMMLANPYLAVVQGSEYIFMRTPCGEGPSDRDAY